MQDSMIRKVFPKNGMEHTLANEHDSDQKGEHFRV